MKELRVWPEYLGGLRDRGYRMQGAGRELDEAAVSAPTVSMMLSSVKRHTQALRREAARAARRRSVVRFV